MIDITCSCYWRCRVGCYMYKVETSPITRLKVSILYVESPPPVDKVVTFSLIKTREPTTFHLLGLDFTHFKYMFWTNFEFILSFTIFWLLGSTWIKMTGPQGNQTNQHTKSPYLKKKSPLVQFRNLWLIL